MRTERTIRIMLEKIRKEQLEPGISDPHYYSCGGQIRVLKWVLGDKY